MADGMEREVRECGCCQKQKPIVGVACIPGIAMSIAWCKECIEADVIPYWAATCNTALCGGWLHTNYGWRYLVANTLLYFNKTEDEFLRDVEIEMEMCDAPNEE